MVTILTNELNDKTCEDPKYLNYLNMLLYNMTSNAYYNTKLGDPKWNIRISNYLDLEPDWTYKYFENTIDRTKKWSYVESKLDRNLITYPCGESSSGQPELMLSVRDSYRMDHMIHIWGLIGKIPCYPRVFKFVNKQKKGNVYCASSSNVLLSTKSLKGENVYGYQLLNHKGAPYFTVVKEGIV